MRELSEPDLVAEPCPYGLPVAGWLLGAGILFFATIVLLQGSL